MVLELRDLCERAEEVEEEGVPEDTLRTGEVGELILLMLTDTTVITVIYLNKLYVIK